MLTVLLNISRTNLMNITKKLILIGIFIATNFSIITFMNLANANEIQWCPYEKSSGKSMGNACYQSLADCERMNGTSIWTEIVCIAVRKK
jgi:hypothetical protein